MVGVKTAALAATAFLASTVIADVDPIVIKGSKFFYKTNGTQFFIRGVAYQEDPSNAVAATTITDPLADEAGCKRDLPFLQRLRTNAIRVYAIDPTKNHDVCMNLLADAGIYVVADLSSPQLSINRNAPTWNMDLYNRYTSVVDLMAKYTNTLGFFAGNEVANNANNTDSMAFVKAAVRDMKAYVKSKNYRPLGVGYAADDDANIRAFVRPYINCGSVDTSVDFFGYNIYSWCGDDSSYTKSGYDQRTAEFKNYSVPAFFAEYGCNTVQPRTFPDTIPLFSEPMSQVWSGGMAYEYFQAERNYGLVEIDGNTVSTRADYAAYSSRIARATPTNTVSAGAYTPSNTALQTCPTVGAVWKASNTLPPSPNSDICACRVANATCRANSNVNTKAYGDLFDYICGEDPASCAPVSGNGTTGKYGAYSMCSSKDRLTIAMDSWYVNHGSTAEQCSFGGNASTTSPSIASSCTASLQSAGGVLGTGVVSGGASGSGGQSGAASASTLPAFNFGVLAVGAYSVVAALAGASIFLL